MYAIIDIETTGGQYNEEGITEIAIYRFDGHEVTDQLISLINPERPIQDFVAKLTGINNKMLRNAPKFYELAKQIVEITQDCILVAHNASFDYRMLQTEFRRLGFQYERDTICTVELSKKLLPDAPSHSLGKLVRSLGIPVSDRHRANGDALATLHLFKLLLTKDITKNIVNQFVKQNLNSKIPPRLLRILDELPTQTGVYYIYNQQGKIIFIGRNKNIRKRVNQHFTSENKIDLYLQKHVFKVMYELTGNDLIAQLKEYQEINENKPSLNGKRLLAPLTYGLVSSENHEGYVQLSVLPIDSKSNYWAFYQTKAEATNTLFELTETFSLCTKLTGFSQARKNCYNYTIGKCYGACVGKESPELYNQRVEAALKKYSFERQTLAVIDKGRTLGEKSVLFIENGIFKGYGFVSLNYHLNQLEILRNIITPMQHSQKVIYLIQKYLRKHKSLEIMVL